MNHKTGVIPVPRALRPRMGISSTDWAGEQGHFLDGQRTADGPQFRDPCRCSNRDVRPNRCRTASSVSTRPSSIKEIAAASRPPDAPKQPSWRRHFLNSVSRLRYSSPSISPQAYRSLSRASASRLLLPHPRPLTKDAMNYMKNAIMANPATRSKPSKSRHLCTYPCKNEVPNLS